MTFCGRKTSARSAQQRAERSVWGRGKPSTAPEPNGNNDVAAGGSARDFGSAARPITAAPTEREHSLEISIAARIPPGLSCPCPKRNAEGVSYLNLH